MLHAGGGPCTARRRLQVAAAVSPSLLSGCPVWAGCRSLGGAAALRSFVDTQDRSIQRRVLSAYAFLRFCSRDDGCALLGKGNLQQSD